MPFGDRFDIRAALDSDARDAYFARKEARAERESASEAQGGAASQDARGDQADQPKRRTGFGDPAGRGKPSARTPSALEQRLTELLTNDPRLPLYMGVAAGLVVLVALVLAIGSCMAPKPEPIEAYDPQTLPSNLVPLAQRDAAGLPLGDDGKLVVMLDPGHGGEDPGVILNDAHEDDINWQIAQYCAAYLRQYEGVEVRFTRTQVESPTLEERAAVAQTYGADILLSFHINWNDDPSQQGVYTYYPYETSLWMLAETSVPGKAVAYAAHDGLVALGLAGNGAWEYTLNANEDPDVWDLTYPEDATGITDYLGIIRCSRFLGIPAVLVEHAFLSNPAEYALLTVDSFVKALGEADAKAVLQCYGFPLV